MESKADLNIKNIQNFLRMQYIILKIAADVLRIKFCEKWKSIFNTDWTNVEENGRLFIEGAGKMVFATSKKIQKNLLKSGNIDTWDLPLIIQSIKCLEKFSYKNVDVADEHKRLDNLKEIRNQLSHQPTTEVTDENFNQYWKSASDILLSFGVTQKTLDEAKNLKFTESPIFSENLTPTNEPNSTKADELKEMGNKFYAVKQYEKAIGVYSEAIQLSGIPIKTLAFLYSNRSLMYLELNDLSNAKDDANGVVHMHPTWWRGYARLADTYEKMKKFEKAIKNFEIALQMNPPDNHSTTLTDSLYYCRRMLGKINRMESIQPDNFVNSMKEVIDAANKQLGKVSTPYEDTLACIGDLMLMNKNVASNDDPAVFSAQGHKFLRGIGGPHNFELAASRFAKAASKGSADGMYNLGALLLEGKGIKRNTQNGIDMFKQAAAQPSFILQGEQKLKLKNEGVSEAKHALGLAYYEGSGVPKSIKNAFTWWARAVEEDGNGASANNIGIMYEEGELITPDIQMAILYWKFAAFDGLVRAMQNLCRVYLSQRNYREACDWYRLDIDNGSVKHDHMENLIVRNKHLLGKFDSKIFVAKLTNELKESRFRNIVLQCEQTKKNMAQMCSLDSENLITEHIVRTAPKTNAAFIIEHRTWFQTMRNSNENSPPAAILSYAHPAKLKGKPNVDIIGLKQIYFMDMDAKVDKIYEGFAIKILIIEDAILGQPYVNVMGQDSHGNVHRIFIYNIPQNEQTQDVVGYGCTITIVNPYHRIGAADGRPMIRVDNPSSIVYHSALTNKKRCRYCGDPEGKILCRHCHRVYYCTKKCLTLDSNENQHKLVCVKKL